MLNREYYLLKLYSAGNTLNINGKVMPIIGAFIGNNMYILATGEKVSPLFEGVRPNHLTYETVTMVKQDSDMVNMIRSISKEDRKAYSDELMKIKLSILDDYVESDDFKRGISLSLNKVSK